MYFYWVDPILHQNKQTRLMSFLKVTNLVRPKTDYISELQISYSPLTPLSHAAFLTELKIDYNKRLP